MGAPADACIVSAWRVADHTDVPDEIDWLVPVPPQNARPESSCRSQFQRGRALERPHCSSEGLPVSGKSLKQPAAPQFVCAPSCRSFSSGCTPRNMQEHLAKWLDTANLTPPSSRRENTVQAPYRHNIIPTVSLVRSLSASRIIVQPRADSEEGDGTVTSTPRSPPVMGREILQLMDSHGSSHSPAGPSSVTMPRLRRVALAPDLDRTPWLHGGGPRPGRKAQVAEAAAGETPSIFSFLRSHFADIDVDNNRQISEQEFIAFVVKRTADRCGGQVAADLSTLLRESARRCYKQATVREDGIRMEDWVHFGLLLTAAPSHLAHHLLNRRLHGQLVQNPFLLKEILNAFEEADVQGAGVLRAQDIEETFVDGKQMVNEMKLDDQGQINYYEFVAFCLGYRRSPVMLNWYDVSYGYAQWVPSAVLGGQRIEGVWHTGIVAFGREYWYGGKVLSSQPGQAPFPPGPVRQTTLGSTLRTREELEDFLRFEMAPRYTRESYDVLRHNCNHFADEVATFLMQGKHIPDEALLQPDTVMSAPLLGAIRPYLNTWLGGFEGTGCDTAIDDLMAEWRARLWPGDLALFVPQAQYHEPVRLVQVSNVDAWRGVCDIVYFEAEGACWDKGQRNTGNPQKLSGDVRVLRLGSCVHSGSYWDWQVQRYRMVPLLSLRPRTLGGKGLAGSAGSGLFGASRAGLKLANPEIQKHLTRKAIIYAHCPQGHTMRPARGCRTWDFGKRDPTCGICGVSIPKSDVRSECTPCAFHLCSPCDRKGLFRGYYSLGSIDPATARLLVQEAPWVRYKAQRYMAAAGTGTGPMGPDIWLRKVAGRLYGDLGIDLPGESRLSELFCNFAKPVDDNNPGAGMETNEFSSLLMELLAVHAAVVTL